MAYYDNDFFRINQDEYIRIDSSFGSRDIAGVVTHIQGEADGPTGSENAAAGVSDLYTLNVAAGETVVINLNKTTQLNDMQLKLSLRTDKPFDARQAAEAKADLGFTTIIAADGEVYRLITNNTGYDMNYYVSVAVQRYNERLGIPGTEDITGIAEELGGLWDDQDLQTRLDETMAEAGDDPGADVLALLYGKYDDVRQLSDSAVDLLEKNPLVSYDLNISRLNDTYAPEMTGEISTELQGNDLRVTWLDGADDLFITEYSAMLYNAAGELVSSLISPVKQFFVNDLAMGSYTVKVKARDYAGNWSEALETNFTVVGEIGFRRGYTEKLFEDKAVKLGEFTVTDDAVFRWQDVVIFGADDTELTVMVVDSLGEIVNCTEWEKGESTVKSDFKLTAGSYSVYAEADQDCDISISLEDLMTAPDDSNNTLVTADLLTLDDFGMAAVSGVVNADDTADYYKLDLGKAGILDFDITGMTPKGKVTLEVYNDAGKKLKSLTVSANKLKGINDLLIDSSAAYLGVIFKGKDDSSLDYSSLVSFREFPDPEYDSLDLPQGILGVSCNEVSGWVGYGDQSDYYRLNLKYPGWYSVGLLEDLDESVRISVYQADCKRKSGFKKVKSVSGKDPDLELLLDPANEYVVEVSAPKASKGGEADYQLGISGIEFSRANLYRDDWSDFVNHLNNAPSAVLGPEMGEIISDEWVGYGDVEDFRRIDLQCVGRYSFDFTVNGPAEFGIYELVAKGSKHQLKKIKSVKHSKQGGSTVTLKDVFLDNGTYYIGVKSTKPKADTGADYSVSINSGTDLFEQANYFVDSWQDIFKGISDAPIIQLTDDPIEIINDEWVGFGDREDFRQLELAYSGRYSFDLDTDGPAELGIYQKVLTKQGYTIKKIKTVSTSKTQLTSITLKNLLLEAGTYYIGVKATRADKGINAEYSVDVNSDTEFFVHTDTLPNDHWNTTEAVISAGESVEGWVGFGDADDFYKLSPSVSGAYTLTLSEVDNPVKFTVYQVKKGKLSALDKTSIKSGYGILSAALEAGQDYYIQVNASKASKAQNTEYLLEADGIEFSDTDDTRFQAHSAVEASDWEGAVIKELDPADWYDLTDVDSLMLEAVSGEFKVRFYDAEGNKVKVEGIINGSGKELKAVNNYSMSASKTASGSIYLADIDDSLRYLVIEGTKKAGTYELSIDVG